MWPLTVLNFRMIRESSASALSHSSWMKQRLFSVKGLVPNGTVADAQACQILSEHLFRPPNLSGSPELPQVRLHPLVVEGLVRGSSAAEPKIYQEVAPNTQSSSYLILGK